MTEKIGVIGGLGTLTAAEFYVEVERLWIAAGQKSHVPLMLENMQSPLSIEESLKGRTDSIPELCPFLCQAAQNLERGGATFIVIPCNTAHAHLEAVRKSVTIPVLSMIETVVARLADEKVARAMILGTSVTKHMKLYEKVGAEQGVEIVYPSVVDQLQIELIIERTLTGEQTGTQNKFDSEMLKGIISRALDGGVDRVVLACTDLQLHLPKQLPIGVVDSLQVLAEVGVGRVNRSASHFIDTYAVPEIRDSWSGPSAYDFFKNLRNQRVDR